MALAARRGRADSAAIEDLLSSMQAEDPSHEPHPASPLQLRPVPRHRMRLRLPAGRRAALRRRQPLHPVLRAATARPRAPAATTRSGSSRTTCRSAEASASARAAWLPWDGRKDGLWAQALGPLEDGVEHGSNRTRIAQLVAMDPRRRDDVSRVFANLGKAIAGYEKSLRHAPTRLHAYLDAVERGDRTAGRLLRADEARLLRDVVAQHLQQLLVEHHDQSAAAC
jgi:hypothetical protein